MTQQSLFCSYCVAAGDEVDVPTTSTSTAAAGGPVGCSYLPLRQHCRPTVASDAGALYKLHNYTTSGCSWSALWNHAVTAVRGTEARDTQRHPATGVSAVERSAKDQDARSSRSLTAWPVTLRRRSPSSATRRLLHRERCQRRRDWFQLTVFRATPELDWAAG